MPEQEKCAKKAKRNKEAKGIGNVNDDLMLMNSNEGNVLDGLFNIVDIEEKRLIKQIPVCQKQNQGARCLMKCVTLMHVQQ